MHLTLFNGFEIPFSNALNATNVLIVDPGGYNPDKALFVRGFLSLLINSFQYFLSTP